MKVYYTAEFETRNVTFGAEDLSKSDALEHAKSISHGERVRLRAATEGEIVYAQEEYQRHVQELYR